MSLWVKICANTSLADARLAVDAGADAVGFVFAPSPRRVTAEQVAAIAPHLPATVEKIGVFVDAELGEIESTVRACGLTGVQLHYEAGPDLPAQLKESFGSSLRVLRVVHFSANAAEYAAAIDRDPNVDAILVDSHSAAAPGGTGIAFDWQAARGALFPIAEARENAETRERHRRIAAGGLTPANVAQAIATLRPWGVDVASGVESSPGKKDPHKLSDFVANARAASLK
jgi:phosphoribosylanthranilate isomerase